MVHYSLVEEPVSDTDYQIIGREQRPALFLGCRIKHKYDEERITANKRLKIKNLRLGDTFLKALKVPCNKASNLDLLYKQLCIVDDSKLTDPIYEKILNGFELSNSECFSYRSTGVYPINSECYDQIASPAYKKLINYYYENFFDRSNTDCKWQNFSYLTLFILINKS